MSPTTSAPQLGRIIHRNPAAECGFWAHPHLSCGHSHISLGELDAARRCFDGDLAISERLRGRSPEDPECCAGLAVTLGNIADLEVLCGRFDQAVTLRDRELSLWKEVRKREPQNGSAADALARCQEKLAEAHQQTGETKDF